MDSKILILLPIWKREKITKIVLGNLKELKKEYNIEVLCVVSEQWAKIEAVRHGFKQVFVSNDDLGHKMNVGVKEALEYKWDYLMNLGSDDLINEKLFELYEPFMYDRRSMFGVTSVTFIDSETKEAKEKDYKILIGAGRMILRSVLEDCVVKNGEVDMYTKGLTCGLDLDSLKRFHKYSHTELKGGAECIVDIKSKDNIWKYNDMNGDKITFDKATKNLRSELIDKILEL